MDPVARAASGYAYINTLFLASSSSSSKIARVFLFIWRGTRGEGTHILAIYYSFGATFPRLLSFLFSFSIFTWCIFGASRSVTRIIYREGRRWAIERKEKARAHFGRQGGHSSSVQRTAGFLLPYLYLFFDPKVRVFFTHLVTVEHGIIPPLFPPLS